jgi:hypothetical protein
MQERNLSYLDRLKHNVYKILTFIIIIYSACIMLLYRSYQDKVEIRKEEILKDYYSKIVKVSTNKINSLVGQLSSSLQSQNISIHTNASDLEVCSDKCINYNLFRFGSLIDQHIPEFIYYKIELNKKFLYSNTKVQSYQIEKTYHLNNYNQFSISLAINKLYWTKVEAEIKKPFWMVTWFVIVNILLLYFLSKISFKSFNKEYTLHYQNKYKEELDQLKFIHSEELKGCKDSLMNKIWNLNFNKQKDLEINCLLAVEANQIALIDENDQETMIKDCRLKNSSDKVPCSIILYQEDKIEEINVAQLIDLFNDRFNQEDENISVQIISRVKEVYFSSKASLYQIIYSLISYLIFIINKQSPTAKHNIRLVIDNIERVIRLRFEYDGFPVTEEKELLKMSNYFFKTHANPFLLNINQVFNILRINGFDCDISYDQCNIIDISQKKQLNNKQITTENNVIFLSSFTEKKK